MDKSQFLEQALSDCGFKASPDLISSPLSCVLSFSPAKVQFRTGFNLQRETEREAETEEAFTSSIDCVGTTESRTNPTTLCRVVLYSSNSK